MRVIVSGGRDQTDKAFVWWVLDDLRLYLGFDEVVVGVDPDFPRGTDKLAWGWAGERGVKRTPFPADWRKFGRAAGPIRNRAMAVYVDPLDDRCIAFPGGDGTDNMIEQARDRGIRVIEVAPKKRVKDEHGNWIDLGRWIGPLADRG